MRTFRREGRLSEEEAHEDVERLNRAAEAVGLPQLAELHRAVDVHALEQLLIETGRYQWPTVSDEIIFGAQRLRELQRIAAKKEPREVHYEERVITAVRDAFTKRFGLDVPAFPTERILLIPDDEMRELSGGPLGMRPPEERSRVEGSYDPQHEIVLVRFRPHDTLASRIHTAGHEVVHWALHQQPGYGTPSLGPLQRLIHEGVTEQAALEITASILAEPDLADEARAWLSSPGWTTRDIFAEAPTLARFAVAEQTRPNAHYNITAYAYPFERFLLEDIVVACSRRGNTVEDPLRVFVHAVTGSDVGTLKRLLRDTYGTAGAKLVYSPGPRSCLEVASELHRLLQKREAPRPSSAP